ISRTLTVNPVARAAADHIAGAGLAAADRGVIRLIDPEPGVAVADGSHPGGTGADEVPLERVVRGANQLNAGPEVAADDVAGPARGAADGVARRAVVEADAFVGIPVVGIAGVPVSERSRAASIDADVVALDDVPGRRATADLNAANGVAADDVACRRRRAP